MRILFDCHSFDAEAQGVRTFLAGLINELPAAWNRAGHLGRLDIHCAAASSTALRAELSVPFDFHRIASGFASRNLVGLPRLARRIRPDVVVSQYVRPGWLDCPSIVVIHDVLFVDLPQYFSWRYRVPRDVLFGWSARYSDHVLTVSEYSSRRIQERYRVDPSRITVVPNATQFTEAQLALAVDAWPTDGDRNVRLIYVARLEERKRHEWCLRLLDGLAAAGIGASLTIVGAGSGTYAETLRATLRRRQLESGPKVRHLEGIDRQTLLAELASADMLIYPSAGEGFGIPVVEAAALGIPCVVSGGTALAELQGCYAGLAFESSSYSEFQSAVMKVIKNLPAYRWSAWQLKEKVVRDFKWSITAERFLAVARRLQGQMP